MQHDRLRTDPLIDRITAHAVLLGKIGDSSSPERVISVARGLSDNSILDLRSNKRAPRIAERSLCCRVQTSTDRYREDLWQNYWQVVSKITRIYPSNRISVPGARLSSSSAESRSFAVTYARIVAGNAVLLSEAKRD